MSILEVHKNNKIEHKQEIEKKQEYKFIGNGKMRKGLTLYAYDYEKKEIYKPELIKTEAFDTTAKRPISTYKCLLNPTHLHIYALNLKSASKKINKLLTAKTLTK